MDKLLFLDIYGLEPKLFFNKQAKYRSYLGLLATIVTVCLTGLFAFLFGTDFFYRSNPIVISQEKILEKSPVIYPTSETFPLFFSSLIKNKPVTNIDDFALSYYFSYSYVERNEEGKLNYIHNATLKPKKCSETGSKNNPLMANYNLDEVFCLDWEELGEVLGEPARIGGVFEENEFTIFRIMIDNCEVDYPKYECKSFLSFDEAAESITNEENILITYYPSFHLDVDSLSDPVIKSFETKSYNLSSSSYAIERRTYEMSTFEDDIGWIFKDVKIYESMRENKFEVETQLNFKDEKKGRIYYYALVNYLGRRTTIIRRRFMKIQELMAMVGGFLKLITLVSREIVKFLAGFKMNLTLVEKTNIKFFRERELVKDNYTAKSIVPVKKDRPKTIKLSLGQYLASRCRCKLSKEMDKYTAFVEELKTKLDIITLIELHEKIDNRDLREEKKEKGIISNS